MRLGTAGRQTKAFLAGVNGAAVSGPTRTVLVNSSGQLGTATASSARLKRNIRPIGGRAAAGVLGLRPLSYRYKRGDGRLQYGLLAEQVAKRFPALAQYGRDGKPDGVYYEQLSVLLLAQVQRQQRELDWLRRKVLERR
jgi:hypothetical protein